MTGSHSWISKVPLAGRISESRQTENLAHTCDLCQSKCPFASCFAYLHKGTFEFRENTDEALDRAGFEFRREEWTQRGGGAVAYAGIECCEKHHNETYRQDNGKPTSAWYHSAKKRKGVGATTRSSGLWTRWKEGRRGVGPPLARRWMGTKIRSSPKPRIG